MAVVRPEASNKQSLDFLHGFFLLVEEVFFEPMFVDWLKKTVVLHCLAMCGHTVSTLTRNLPSTSTLSRVQIQWIATCTTTQPAAHGRKMHHQGSLSSQANIRNIWSFGMSACLLRGIFGRTLYVYLQMLSGERTQLRTTLPYDKTIPSHNCVLRKHFWNRLSAHVLVAFDK